MECIQKGIKGWKPPNAMSLNAWLSHVWSESWPEKIPAPELYMINLWKELVKSIPTPQPLKPDFGLYHLLDENYSTMIRHKINPCSGPPSTPLVEWRRDISRMFKETLDELDLFHPSEFPSCVMKAITENIITCPDRISLVGFEFPAPLETDLFELLEGKSYVEYEVSVQQKQNHLEAITLPSPEQEVIYLAHRLIEDAGSLPLHRIGVVVPDFKSYSGMIERSLKELMGEKPPEGASWFNITLGIPLIDSMLIKAALIPLRLMSEGESRELFLSLILSPYYGCWQGKRHDCARADIIWRTHSIESGLDNLLNFLKKNNPEILGEILCDEAKDLLKFAGLNFSRRKTVDYWINTVEELWSSLGFPVISDEKDTVDSGHLKEITHDISAHLGHVVMNGHEFYSFLKYIASYKITQISAPENAGIQILGLIESRGLDFDKLYVLGLDDRTLPQPVRPLPLLDTSERKLIQGGTPESQYEFGLRAFSNLISLAPSVTLLRAEQENSKPLTSSPFWPKSESEKYLDIWSDPGPAWVRAGWLRSAYEGLQIAAVGGEPKIAGIKTSDDTLLEGIALPNRMSASILETAIICPFRFFADAILKIKPLEEMRPVVSPMERGIRIHRILASFTGEVRKRDIHLELDRQKAIKLLSECVDEVLRDVAGRPQWDVERRLLLSENSPPGILISWLDAEIRHRQDGWRCITEEASFKGLKRDGWSFPLEGRIDRIDYHKDEGLICWDYKTGNHPNQKDVVERLTAPQLPVYLLALRTGKVPDMNKYLHQETLFYAGYMQLKTPAKVKMNKIRGMEESLDKWVEVIADIEKILQMGDFHANPYPVSNLENKETACENCPFITLCERGIVQEE
jgi:RecB family exonuclease